MIGQAEVAGAVGDELVELFKGALIEQEIDAFPGREFAFAMLAFAALRAAPFFSGLVPAVQFVKAGHRFILLWGLD